MPSPEVLQAFWNSRAALGAAAGTRDRILKRLEIEEIARHVKHGMSILDVGCGTGETAIELANRFEVRVCGFDYAPSLVKAADAAEYENASWRKPRCHFTTGVLGGVGGGGAPFQGRTFDLVYTERCLINLPDWGAQRKAILQIAQWVKPGGHFLMVESSWNALVALNYLRRRVGLLDIDPPWHNRYLVDEEIFALSRELTNPFSPAWPQPSFTGTYYFLSRVVNAALAARAGTEPDYDAPVNKLALDLPGDLVPDVGQTRAWLWERR